MLVVVSTFLSSMFIAYLEFSRSHQVRTELLWFWWKLESMNGIFRIFRIMVVRVAYAVLLSCPLSYMYLKSDSDSIDFFNIWIWKYEQGSDAVYFIYFKCVENSALAQCILIIKYMLSVVHNFLRQHFAYSSQSFVFYMK